MFDDVAGAVEVDAGGGGRCGEAAYGGGRCRGAALLCGPLLCGALLRCRVAVEGGGEDVEGV